MSHDPALFTPLSVPALAPHRLAAVPGIRLEPRGGRFLVHFRQAMPAPAFEPFPLPVIPSNLLDALTRLLRFSYRRAGIGAAVLLHLDPKNGAWSASCPEPQPALTQPAVANLATSLKPKSPPMLIDPLASDGRRLAGGYFSTHSTTIEMLIRQVPEVDGVWLFHLVGTWATVVAFARVGCNVIPTGPRGRRRRPRRHGGDSSQRSRLDHLPCLSRVWLTRETLPVRTQRPRLISSRGRSVEKFMWIDCRPARRFIDRTLLPMPSLLGDADGFRCLSYPASAPRQVCATSTSNR